MNLRAIPAMISMIPSVIRGVDLRALEKIKVIARRAYPRVQQVTIRTLAKWLQDKGNDSLLLVDVRAPNEFAVSHLPDAVNLQTAEQIEAAITDRRPTQTVLYCSVGFRSSRLANALIARGNSNVANLEGSIFEWANEGNLIFSGKVRVQQVHPFGRRWSGLLKPGLASPCQ